MVLKGTKNKDFYLNESRNIDLIIQLRLGRSPFNIENCFFK